MEGVKDQDRYFFARKRKMLKGINNLPFICTPNIFSFNFFRFVVEVWVVYFAPPQIASGIYIPMAKHVSLSYFCITRDFFLWKMGKASKKQNPLKHVNKKLKPHQKMLSFLGVPLPSPLKSPTYAIYDRDPYLGTANIDGWSYSYEHRYTHFVSAAACPFVDWYFLMVKWGLLLKQKCYGRILLRKNALWVFFFVILRYIPSYRKLLSFFLGYIKAKFRLRHSFGIPSHICAIHLTQCCVILYRFFCVCCAAHPIKAFFRKNSMWAKWDDEA